MLKKLRLIGKSAPVDCLNFTSAVKEVNQGGGGSYFGPIHSLMPIMSKTKDQQF